MSLVTSPTRSRFKRAALVLSAGLFATTLAIGGGLAASAAPSLLSASTASANGYVTVTVAGFAPSEALTFNFDSTEIHKDFADGTGAFTGPLYLPEDATVGAHTINIVGTTSPAQSEPLEIVAQPTVSPATAKVTVSAFGTTGVTLTFSGFTAGESVQLGGGTGNSGGGIGAAVTVGASGDVTYKVRSSDFGSGTALPGLYYVSGGTVAGNISAKVATITVVADAAPAKPVKARASFTG